MFAGLIHFMHAATAYVLSSAFDTPLFILNTRDMNSMNGQ
jgi:hypothetical protein